MYLDKRDMAKISQFIQRCQRTQKDFVDVSEHYKRCNEQDKKALMWWQSPIGVVSISLGSLIVGMVLENTL